LRRAGRRQSWRATAKAAEVLARVARESLAWTGSEAARGTEVRETGVKQRALEAIERRGLWTNEGPIVAFGPTSAMPTTSRIPEPIRPSRRAT